MTCQSTSTAFSTHWFPHWRHLQSISRHGKLTDFDQLFQLLYYHYYHHHSIFDNIIIILKRKKNYWTWAQLWIRNTLTETSMIDGRQGLLRTSRYLPLDYSYSAQLFHINMNNNNNNKLGARFKKKKKANSATIFILLFWWWLLRFILNPIGHSNGELFEFQLSINAHWNCKSSSTFR